MHFYGWKKGLKTGMYYLRTRPAAQAIQFTVDQTALKAASQVRAEQQVNGLADTRVNGTATIVAASTVHASTTVPAPAPTPAPKVAAVVAAVQLTDSPSIRSSESDPPASPTHSHYASPIPSAPLKSEEPEPLSLDGGAAKVVDPEYAAALQRQKERELAEAKLMCSLENKEACLMCSG